MIRPLCEVAAAVRRLAANEPDLPGALVEAVDQWKRHWGDGARAGLWHVPGRIELLGKHTDYAGGRALLAATRQGLTVAAVERPDAVLEAFDAADGTRQSVPLDDRAAPRSGWGVYVAAVARRVATDFQPPLSGARIAFSSTLPRAAGLSSSSALVTALFVLLAAFNRPLPELGPALERREGLAAYLAVVEGGGAVADLGGQDGVGTRGGGEDHLAILASRTGELAQVRFLPTVIEGRLALDPELTFVLAASGVAAAKTGAAKEAFNRLSDLAAEAAAVWRRASGRADPHLGAAAAAVGGETLLSTLRRSRAPREILRRTEQFVIESEELVPAATAALASGDLLGFGSLVDRSHGVGAELLGHQVPETLFLARSARRLGALAASAGGAGFGGSVWALTEVHRADQLAQRWQRAYERRFPNRRRQARFLTTRPSAGARPITFLSTAGD